jgi:Tol biopolymer transport system component
VALTPGTRIGPYEIAARIGAGGMGEVYRATDTNLKRQVAIKVLPDAVLADSGRLVRFQREAELLASLNHPNIAQIYGLERTDGLIGLVMELVEGQTLAGRLKAGPLGVAEAREVARQITEGLKAAHAKGIVHRDLKPDNVALRPDGTVKLLDFGVAKALESVDDQATTVTASAAVLTVAGMVIGTPAYMSPEQSRGQAVDARSDIWSFGVVLYEMLTGRRPFGGVSTAGTIGAATDPEPDWTRVPGDFVHLLQWCLERDPVRRLQHIGDAAHILDRPVAVVVRGHTGRSRASWLIAAACAAAALAAVTWAWRVSTVRDGNEVVHADVVPPVGTTFHGGEALPVQAISPDGSTLAFVAADAGGARRIWVRPLESPVARPLRGTELANGLFWSPDSRSLAFLALEELRRIDVSTNEVRVIGRATDVRGGTWGSRGVILLGSITEGILRFPADGGAPTQATVRATGENFHFYPQFLPDGDRFLYAIDNPPGVYVGSLSEDRTRQERRAVLSGFLNVAYAPTPDRNAGYLLFVRDRTLYAQAFNPLTLGIEAAPIPISTDVGDTTAQEPSQFSVSETGVLSTIAATRGVVSEVSRDGRVLGSIGEPGPYITMRPSPDGQRVLLLRAETGAPIFELWTMDRGRAAPTRWTNNRGNAPFQAWSPDGTKIAYSSNHDGPYDVFNVFTQAFGSREAVPIPPTNEHFKAVYDWTTEGIVYSEDRSADVRDLLLWPANGGKAVPLVTTGYWNYDGAVSPDGRWLVFVSNETGTDEIYVQPFPSGRPDRVSADGGTSPAWGPGTRELFFNSPEGQLMVVRVGGPGGPTFGTPAPLFKLNQISGFQGASLWAPLKSGTFLVLQPSTVNRTVHLTLNWPALLED